MLQGLYKFNPYLSQIPGQARNASHQVGEHSRTTVGDSAVGRIIVPAATRLTRLEPDVAPVPNFFCWAASPLYFAEKFCPCAPFFRAPKGALYTERNFPLFRPGTNNTKTDEVDAVVREAVVAPVGDSAVVAVVVPAATAQDTHRPRRDTRRRCARAYGAVTVPAPFIYVTAHVVQA